MGIKKRLSFAEWWILSQLRGTDTNTITIRSGESSFRPRLDEEEIELIEAIREQGAAEAVYDDIEAEVGIDGDVAYVDIDGQYSFIALSKEAAEEEKVDRYFDSRGNERLLSGEIIKESESLPKAPSKLVVIKDGRDVGSVLQKISEQFSDKELALLAKGKSINISSVNHSSISFEGDRFRIGLIGDTHYGSVYTDPSYTMAIAEEFDKREVDIIMHTGDVTEGLSHRPGHMYELTHIGYEAQKAHAIEMLSHFKQPIKMIDGNHDRWYLKSSGALIVKDICEALPNAEFLGHDEADIIINGIVVKLWHGEDGSSYATSYRVQKIVESLQGGTKPHILFAGHVHKQIYMFERNIHCVSSACIQRQSSWMRGKRLPAHTGFHIVDVVIGDGEVKSFLPKFYPFYR